MTSLNEVHDVSIIPMRPLRVEADAAADGAADDAEASLLPYRRPGRPRALLSTSVSRLLLDGTCALAAFRPAQTWLLPLTCIGALRHRTAGVSVTPVEKQRQRRRHADGRGQCRRRRRRRVLQGTALRACCADKARPSDLCTCQLVRARQRRLSGPRTARELNTVAAGTQRTVKTRLRRGRRLRTARVCSTQLR